MGYAAKIFYKSGVNTEHGMFIILPLDYVSHGHRARVVCILEIPWIQGLEANLVKNFAAFRPWLERVGRGGGFCAAEVLVFVVFLGPSDDPVLDDFLNNLNDFSLGIGKI